MARPDLPPGYGGWQAIDSTPQEKSMGKLPNEMLYSGSRLDKNKFQISCYQISKKKMKINRANELNPVMMVKQQI